MKKIGWCTVVLALMFFCWAKNVQGSELNLSEKLSLVGFQISTNVILNGENVGVGVRTVFEVETEIQGKRVEHVGVIYGLVNDSNRYSELQLETERKDVYAFTTPEEGKILEKEIQGVTINRYAMTMPVYQGLKQAYYVRPYAVLEDGSVVYGHSGTYSAFVIADYLYQRSLLNSEQLHQEYYEEILQRAEMDYEKVVYQPEQNSGQTAEEIYYDSLEKALEDLENRSEDNAVKNPETAKLMLWKRENGSVLKLLSDIELKESVTITENAIVNLNDYTLSAKHGEVISFAKDLTIKNGTMEFQDAVVCINDCSQEQNRLTLRQLKILHENTIAGKKTVTVYADSVRSDKVTVDSRGMQMTQGLVVKDGTSEIKNTEICAHSETENGFGIATSGKAKATVVRAEVSVDAAQWSMGNYVSGQSKVQLKECQFRCDGKTNNVPVYVDSSAEVEVQSGRYEGVPVPNKNGDSYGTGIFNMGTVTVIDGEIIGGNCGILCKTGSVTLIQGGVFKSPNHGGIYCSCGSTGRCEINGGSYFCNREEYDEEQLGTIVSFGAAYFGCADQSEAWSVDVHHAIFKNLYGNAVVQKSNNQYVPATINLYYCQIEAKNYAVWIQNNESVDVYNALVNLFYCETTRGALFDERYKETGVSRITLMY